MFSQKKANETDFLSEFIRIYKEHPALWKIKSPEYSNRQLKETGYKALVELYKAYDIPNGNIEVVKKKIASLRAAFRRELKKKSGKKSGMGTDDGEDYEPNLWYFDLLLFTTEHEENRETLDNTSNDNTEKDFDLSLIDENYEQPMDNIH